MKRALLLLALVLAGCAKPANISTSLDVSTRPPDMTVITMRVKNLEARATTPLAIVVTAQLRNGSEWGKSTAVIHPAAFVLSRQEEQILRTTLKQTGDAIRGTYTVKEQESGRTLVSEKFEKALKR